jgi:hypothetical protein
VRHFTFPAAPDASQPPIVNQIYWPDGDLARRRAQDTGVPARVGDVRRDRILMIEGPLAFALRPGRLLAPRIENAAVTADDPPTPARVRSWVRQGIHVEGRPEWVFVKVHTHGAPEKLAARDAGRGRADAARRADDPYNDGKRWKLHCDRARDVQHRHRRHGREEQRSGSVPGPRVAAAARGDSLTTTREMPT